MQFQDGEGSPSQAEFTFGPKSESSERALRYHLRKKSGLRRTVCQCVDKGDHFLTSHNNLYINFTNFTNFDSALEPFKQTVSKESVVSRMSRKRSIMLSHPVLDISVSSSIS